MAEESVTLAITWEGAFIEAKTVGGLIENTRKLLIYAAKDAGLACNVVMRGIDWQEQRAEFHFLVIPKFKPATPTKEQPRE